MIPAGIQPPRDLTSPAPEHAPAKAHHTANTRLRLAAHHAKTVYPGPVGELIAAELTAVESWGYSIASTSRAHRLAEHVLELAGRDHH